MPSVLQHQSIESLILQGTLAMVFRHSIMLLFKIFAQSNSTIQPYMQVSHINFGCQLYIDNPWKLIGRI